MCLDRPSARCAYGRASWVLQLGCTRDVDNPFHFLASSTWCAILVPRAARASRCRPCCSPAGSESERPSPRPRPGTRCSSRLPSAGGGGQPQPRQPTIHIPLGAHTRSVPSLTQASVHLSRRRSSHGMKHIPRVRPRVAGTVRLPVPGQLSTAGRPSTPPAPAKPARPPQPSHSSPATLAALRMW